MFSTLEIHFSIIHKLNRGQVPDMSKLVKYILITVASLGVLIIVGIVAVTMLVDVESYKPKIEQLVTEKTGYPLTLGGDIDLSFFPWIGLRFTDLRLDNPKGFADKKFVHIDTFQARVKVLPLLSRKVEISKFVVNKPEIFLVRNPQGVWNWQKLTEGNKPEPTTTEATQAPRTKAPTKTPTTAGGESGKQPTPASEGQNGFVLQSLNVEEFAITDGRIGIDDKTSNMKHEVSDFNLKLDDVSLDNPVKLTMDAQLDGKPLSLKGTVGPLGSDPGAGKINLDFTAQALETLKIQTSGYLDDLKGQKKYKLAINVAPFNLKELFSSLDLNLPITTADPKALEKVGLKTTATGDINQVVLSDTAVQLDDTTINLDLTAKDFSRPDVAFNVGVDAIDLDRYLPPAQAENRSASAQDSSGKAEKPGKQAPEQTAGTTTSPGTTPTATRNRKAAAGAVNYEPLRKLVLKGTMKVGKMKVHGGNLSNLALDVAGRNGIFTLNSLGMDLYEGNIAGTGKLNVQKNTPVTALDVTMQNVQAGPLLKDFAQKEIIEGRLKAEVNVNLQGDNADLIKQSLNGKGDLLFQDGALVGIDLAQLARTIKQGFTLEQQEGEKPRTDFAELHAPFTITNGIVDTPGTTLQSPFIRATVTGTANLPSEALDMKIKPTLVGTIKGQGDEKERSGLTIPIVVSGTFNSPKFRPDVESLVKDQLPTEEELNQMIKSGKVPAERKEKLKKDIEQTKGLLKGLFGK